MGDTPGTTTWHYNSPNAGILPMGRGITQNYYSFQILSEEQVRHSTLFGQPSNPMSLNYRLGNMDTTAKNTELTWTSFTCTPQLTRDGEAIYICSNSLSAHTGVLPAGMKLSLIHISEPTRPY